MSLSKLPRRVLGIAVVALGALAAWSQPVPAPSTPPAPGTFVLAAVDPAGKEVAAEGKLSHESGRSIEVRSGTPVEVAAGTYTLSAAMRTANGNLYKPVTQSVQIASGTEAKPTVAIKVPPTVRASIVTRGLDTRGTFVRAYRDGKELFKFRPEETVFVDEGAYEFRARPEPPNELIVRERFAAGERKTVVFDLGGTVLVRAKLRAAGSGIWLRQFYELWQGGEVKYSIDPLKGTQVRPGTYELRLADKLTPWSKPGVVVTAEPEQSFEFEVPMGHVTVLVARADGTPVEGRDCLIGAGADGAGYYRATGRPIPLVPGVYNAAPIDAPEQRQVFEVLAGEDTRLTLRAQD